MSYSLAIGSIQVIPDDTGVQEVIYTCEQTRRACMPSFVFSIAGQVGFRTALEHLIACRSRQCISLRKKVRESMHEKLKWLFEQDVLLGCLVVQPLLYKAHMPRNITQPQHFIAVANHLSQCPHESCATLRRALLLKVRDCVSPNIHEIIGH